MPFLTASQYDESYFKGTHPAGYTDYSVSNLYQYWESLVQSLKPSLYTGKKVLELGCGNGWIVERMRAVGINAYGVDVSSYIVGTASQAVRPYLTIGDIRSVLANYKRNDFDLVCGLGILECFTDQEIMNIVNECVRIGREHVFYVYPNANPTYYNSKTMQEWRAFLPQSIIVVNYHTGERL